MNLRAWDVPQNTFTAQDSPALTGRQRTRSVIVVRMPDFVTPDQARFSLRHDGAPVLVRTGRCSPAPR
jgi:hypothetical protein